MQFGPPGLAEAPAPGPVYAPRYASAEGNSIISSPGFLAGILAGCTLLAVLLWVALAVQTKRMNLARAKAQRDDAAKRAALTVPVVVIQPDESMEFGAKLYRTESGTMRPIEHIFAAARQQAAAAPAPVGSQVAAAPHLASFIVAVA